MVSISLIGRAVRLWDSWYALCSFCGCFMKLHPNNRYEAELCCLRCDYDMLNKTSKNLVETPDTTSNPVCRFCGKVGAFKCPLPCAFHEFACAHTGRPETEWSEVETGQVSVGHGRSQFKTATTPPIRTLLSSTLSRMDADVHENNAHPRDSQPRCVRSEAMLRRQEVF